MLFIARLALLGFRSARWAQNPILAVHKPALQCGLGQFGDGESRIVSQNHDAALAPWPRAHESRLNQTNLPGLNQGTPPWSTSAVHRPAFPPWSASFPRTA